MNALNMIQSSLDTLREARPDYTPRIGHIWPILDPPSVSKREKAVTRPGSVMPEGTPAEGSSSPTKAPEMKLPKQGENEAAQPWEPFYNAFTFTMNEVLRKRPQRTVPVAAPKLAVPISEVESHTQPDHLTGKRPSLTKSGGKTSVTRLTERGAQGAGTSAYGDKPGVPTADVPHKKRKGQPGPPGQPGAGKKKMRRARTLTLLSLPWLIILRRDCCPGGEEGGVGSRRIFPISFIIKCFPTCQYRFLHNIRFVVQPLEIFSLVLLLSHGCQVEMPQVDGTEGREITQLQLTEIT